MDDDMRRTDPGGYCRLPGVYCGVLNEAGGFRFGWGFERKSCRPSCPTPCYHDDDRNDDHWEQKCLYSCDPTGITTIDLT